MSGVASCVANLLKDLVISDVKLPTKGLSQ